MNFSKEKFLFHLGWNDFFQNQFQQLHHLSSQPARVIAEERNLYRLQFAHEECVWASITGKMHFEAGGRSDLPAVGDWVLAEILPSSERAVIRHVFDRKSALYRKQVGAATEIQIFSANIDTVFIATSLNNEINYPRLERYLTLAWDSGATPVILLTKADLLENIEDASEILLEMESTFPGVHIHQIARDDFHQADFLSSYIKEGTTSVIIGPSGVGKSTLVNFLVGHEVLKTQEIRESDGKGRHTTTSRSLFHSYLGGLIIDTPGVRELQLADHQEGLETNFADIEELKTLCRFSNCHHQSEPGCAINESLESGVLNEKRWLSYQKLLSELRHEKRKQNKALLAADRKQWKKTSMNARKRAKILRSSFS